MRAWLKIGLRFELTTQTLKSRRKPPHRPRHNETTPDEFGDVEAKIAMLEASLEEVFKVENLLNSTADEDEKNKIIPALRKVYSDDAIAEQAFNALGPDLALQSVVELNPKRLKIRLTKIGSVATSNLDTFFSMPAFLLVLGVSEDQKHAIEEMISTANAEHKSNIEMRLEMLAALVEDRWEELLAVLSGAQQKTARTAFGHPVQWFRIPEVPEFFQRIEKDGVFRGGTLFGTKFLNSGLAATASKEDLEAFEVDVCPSLCYNMIFERVLWDELELVDEQRKQVGKELRLKLGNVILARPASSSRFKLLLKGKASYPADLKEFFRDHQLTWFRQVETQIRAQIRAQFRASNGLLNPIVIDELKLDRSQIAKLTEIADKYEKQCKDIAAEIQEDRDSAKSKLDQEIVESLSDEQAKKYWKMIGEKPKGA